MNDNPYEAPSSNLVDHGANSESDSIREAHIKHEASVKSIGVLYYLGGALMLIAALGMLILTFETDAKPEPLVGLPGFIGILYAFLGVASLVVGRGLRALSRWVKIPVGILSGLGLLSIPVGTIINGYILYLVFCGKGKTVLSDEYKLVIAQTPDIEYRTPKWIWVLVLILLAFIALALFGAFYTE